jgi:Domain of unknown function (DUF4386)
MTRIANSRMAGGAFLAYIAAGISLMALFGRATAGPNVAAKLVSMAQHETAMRVSVLLIIVCGLCAFVLGVTLYALTRDEDPDLAMLGLVCRVAEGISGIFVARTLTLVWLAKGAAGTLEEAATQNMATLLLQENSASVGATLFAIGSTIFVWLLLRGRMVPRVIAVLGVLGSALLVIALPGELAGFYRNGWWVWLPCLFFELSLAAWLLTKGAAPAARRSA